MIDPIPVARKLTELLSELTVDSRILGSLRFSYWKYAPSHESAIAPINPPKAIEVAAMAA